MPNTHKCKICSSPLRTEIERKAANGESIAAISRWAQEQGLNAHYGTISRHLKNHFFSQDAFVQQLQESRELAEAQVAKEVDRVRVAQENIARCVRIRNLLQEKLEDQLREGKKVSYTDSNFYTSLTAEIRQNVALLHELLSGSPEIAITLQSVYEEIEKDTQEGAS